MNDAAFAFVKKGFDESIESNLVPMPSPDENAKSDIAAEEKQEAKSDSTKGRKTSARKSAKPISRSRESDHLVSVSTRIPSSLFADLKTVALKRQLANEKPNSIQEIVTQAAENWLIRNTGKKSRLLE